MSKPSLWVTAAKILADHPTKSVSCPECGKKNLVVFDTTGPTGFESEMVERYLVCPSCKSYNIMLLKRRTDQKGLVIEFDSPITISEALQKLNLCNKR